MPLRLRVLSKTQLWPKVELRRVKEGLGVFSTEDIGKNEPVCNYGGDFLTAEYAETFLLKYENLCDYLLQLRPIVPNGPSFYLNHFRESKTSKPIYGKYLNHSRVHPNLYLKQYSLNSKLDVIFYAKNRILKGTELVWNYGKKYQGVDKCVNSCKKCRTSSI